jgi:hypothetical protein
VALEKNGCALTELWMNCVLRGGCLNWAAPVRRCVFLAFYIRATYVLAS